jgi:ElaB/YqjD/DUF883 family membrane-anchored ribosome-binding protein
MKPIRPTERLFAGRNNAPQFSEEPPMTQTSSSTLNRGADTARQTADDLADKAADVASRAGDQIERTVQSLTEQSRQATEQLQVVADNFKTAVDKSVRDQPLTTLAVAAGVGFVIGALWKS